MPCARIFAVCIISGTRRRPPLPCVARRTHGKEKTHGKPYSSPCAKGQHTANLDLRRGSASRHTANMDHVRGTPFCRQGELTAVIVCRVPGLGTRRTPIFAVCQSVDTRRTPRLSSTLGRTSRQSLFAVCPRWHTATHRPLSCALVEHTANTEKKSCFCFQIFSTLFIICLVLYV